MLGRRMRNILSMQICMRNLGQLRFYIGYWTLDVVYPSCQHSMCVTKAYGRYFTGTGSVLYCGQQQEPPRGCGGATRSCDEGAGGAGAASSSSSSLAFPQRTRAADKTCLHDRRSCDATGVVESRSLQVNQKSSDHDFLKHHNMEELVRKDTTIITEQNTIGEMKIATDVALVVVSSSAPPAAQKPSASSTGTALENATTPACAICSPQAKEMLSKFGNQRLRYFHPLEVFKLMGFPCGQTRHELEVEGHNYMLGLQNRRSRSCMQATKRTHRSKNHHVFSLPQAISNRQAWGLAGNSLNPRVVGYLVEGHFDFFLTYEAGLSWERPSQRGCCDQVIIKNLN